MPTFIEKAREWIHGSSYPVILTGAGISAESGVPTFRGAEGLWKNHRPEELATPMAFYKNPEMVWEWYNWRRSIVQAKEPNSGHLAINNFQYKFPELTVITQNVDGLHIKAGNRNVIEMHGNLFKARCLKCEHVFSHETTTDSSPVCKLCGAKLRPHIVWFGEMIDEQIMHQITYHLNQTDLLLVVGTSGMVYPAAGFARQVMQRGSKVIEVNIAPTLQGSLNLRGKSGDILPELV
ncbi:MAG: NAD-dependent deacylase [Spirochaetia bacterium]|nr:NAD-dependent deacylase [Spirochaetia bacterium]